MDSIFEPRGIEEQPACLNPVQDASFPLALLQTPRPSAASQASPPACLWCILYFNCHALFFQISASMRTVRVQDLLMTSALKAHCGPELSMRGCSGSFNSRPARCCRLASVFQKLAHSQEF